MTFNNSKLTLWALSVTSVILVVLLVLDIYHIRTQNEEVSRLLRAAEESAEAENLVQSIRSLQNSAEAELEDFDKAAVSDDDLVEAIEMIEKAGRTLGLQYEIVGVDKIEEGAPRVRIALESEGSWPDTFSLLRAVESLPYRVLLEEAALFKGEGDPAGGGASWLSRITLSLYLFNSHESRTK